MRLLWEALPRMHPDYCTRVPQGQDCRLYAIKDAEEKYGKIPELRSIVTI